MDWSVSIGLILGLSEIINRLVSVLRVRVSSKRDQGLLYIRLNLDMHRFLDKAIPTKGEGRD